MASRFHILLRAFLVLAGLAAALLLVLVLTPWPAAFVKNRILENISMMTGGQVSIGTLEIHAFPLRLVLTDIRLEQGDPSHPSLRLTSRKADLRLPYRAYRGRFDRIESLDLENPEVFLDRTTPSPAKPGTMTAPLLPVSIGRVVVEGGVLEVRDSRSDWEAKIGGIALRAESAGAAPGSFVGRMERGSGSIRVGDRRVEGEVASDFKMAGRTMSFSGLQVVAAEGFRASGSLDLDFSGPNSRLRLGARASLAPAKSPRPILGDLSGSLEVDAEGEVTEEGVRLHGPVRSSEIRFAGRTLRSLTGNAEYRHHLLELREARSEALGGILSGDATLTWGEGGTSDTDLKASVSLEKGSAEEILSLLQLGGISFSGQVSHRGEYHLQGASLDTLEASGDIAVEGAFAQLPRDRLRGTTRFHLSGKTLELSHARVSGRGLEGSFDGTVPLSSSLKGGGAISLEALDLSRFERFLDPLPPAARMPLSEILAESDEAKLSFRGNLLWDQGTTSVEGAAVCGPLLLRSTRLGSLEADFRASPRSLDFTKLVLTGGETTLDLQGEWRGEDEKIRLKGVAGSLPIAWLKEWAALDWPVEGRLTASMDLSGSVSRPLGSLDLVVEEPKVASIHFDRIEGQMHLGTDEVTFEPLRAIRGGGEVIAKGSLGLRGKPLSIEAEGKDLDLGWLHDVGLPANVAGPFGLHAKLGGTLDAPLLEAEATTPSISLSGVPTGPVKATFSADRQEGALVVVPELKGVNFAGRILWDERYSFDGDLILEQFQVPVAQLGPDFPVTNFETTLTGGIRVEGALRNPARFDAYGNLVKVSVRLGPMSLESQVPAFFRWSSPRLEITPLRLKGEGTDLTLKGVATLETGSYHFSAEGTVALAALASFYPGLVASGTGDVHVEFDSSEQGSRLTGWAGVHQGRLHGAGLPVPISEMEGKVVLDAPGDFHLEAVRLTAGGGDMSVEGKGRLHGLLVAAFDLRMKGSNVQIAYPEGFRGRYDMDLAMIQDEIGRRLSGEVHLVRGVYSRNFDIERNLLSFSRAEDLAAEVEAQEESALSTMKLDVTLRAERGLWIINDLAKLEGFGVLQIGGTVGYPQITGRVSAFEGGIVRFRQVEYRVDRGNIDLVDLDRFNPYFDIAGETRVQDYDVFLKIEGSLEHVEYELTSNPPLSQQDIIALLVAGRTLENVGSFAGGQQAFGESAAAALTGSLASGFGGKIQSAARLDQFSIDPVILGREGDPASRITVGKQISENLFAAYSTLLGGSSEEIYQLDYKIGRDFKLTSTRDSDGGVGGDVRYGWRLKTGPGAGAAPPAAPRWIRSLIVEGDPLISPGKLRRLLGLKEGDKMDRRHASAGEEKLVGYYHRKDHLQATVEASEVEVEGESNLSDLRLKVEPGPKVLLKVEGTKSDRSYRRKIRDFWKESVFPDETPEEARARLERLLRREGYYQAKVSLTLPVDTPQERQAIFRAERGARAHVDRIDITGNQVIPTDELLRLIRSKPGKHSYLNPEQASSDAGRIRGQYLYVGYPDARVPTPEIVLSPDGTSAAIRFQVTEGTPKRLASVRVEGNNSLYSASLLEAVPLKAGLPFLRSRARLGADQIRSIYDREGFRGTRVSYELRGADGTDLVYKVEEGPRRFVGGIELEGNLLTRDEVVERELTFKAGDPLSRDEMLKSQRALYRLGVFQTVEFVEKEGTDIDHPVLRIRVSEANNLLQSVGIGYDSTEGIRGLYDITNTNFAGRGRTLSLTLRGSQIDSRAQVLLKDPFLFNRRLDSLIAAYWEHQERESFTEETLGTTLQVSKKHTKADRTFYRYTLKDVDVTDLQVPEEVAGAQSLRLSGPSFSLTHDTRDDFFNPHKGVFGSFDVGLVARALGSDVNFERVYLTGSMFRTLAKGTVWAQSIRTGFLVPGRDTPEIPISERFFAGGDTTVRGFGRDQVGPKEVDPVTGEIGDPLGGETVFIVNEEMRFPIWRFLRGTVFFDAGNVTFRVRDYDPFNLRTVLGLGIRIDTPIGPFRLEYGWKLDRQEDESPGELNLSIGQAF